MDLALAKHAFVTGGASGIGLAIAEALAARGVPVTVADMDREELEAVVARHGGRLRAQVLDVRDREGWALAKAEAEAALGPVDILVNNAGIAPDGSEFADMDPASFDRIIAINLTGVFNGVSAFAADLRARGRGHVVNTASQAGIAPPFPGIGGYAAAKAGVVAISEGLRRELAPHGVGVSVLCPGLVTTNLGRNTVKLGGQLRGERLQMPESGVTAAAVGEMVVDGIVRNRPYIVTHPDLWPSVEQRCEALRQAFHPAG
jgi:NAD(P)-dependent dehydrogenase (short-subunit alcohol dehydrogenase family)